MRRGLIAIACVTAASAVGSPAALAGTIGGRVTNAAGQPLSPCVDLYTVSGLKVFPTGGGTGLDGTYSLAGLPAGQYKVHLAACAGNYASEWYAGRPTRDSATPVSVTATGSTTGVNAALAVGGRILGTVTDRAGQPFADACISTYGGSDDVEQRQARTDGAGGYVVEGLQSGSYIVGFRPCGDELLARQYFRGQAGLGAADPVPVRAGADTTGITGALVPFGKITGRVTGPEGQPLTGVCVDASAPGITRGDSRQDDPLDSARTDSSGHYVLNAVAPGAQVVDFNGCYPSGNPYAPQYYRDKGFGFEADRVPVASEQTTVGIDARLRLMDTGLDLLSVRPILRGVRIVPARFVPARHRGHRRLGGAQLRFRATRVNSLRMRVQTRRPGRMTSGRCRSGAHSGRRCSVNRTLRGRILARVQPGLNRIRLSGHWNGRPLRPGRYRLRLRAQNFYTSAATTVAFRILGSR